MRAGGSVKRGAAGRHAGRRQGQIRRAAGRLLERKRCCASSIRDRREMLLALTGSGLLGAQRCLERIPRLPEGLGAEAVAQPKHLTVLVERCSRPSATLEAVTASGTVEIIQDPVLAENALAGQSVKSVMCVQFALERIIPR
jgi:hypothetical protein